MKKILIIGMSGSGKSTLAIKLGKMLNLPVIHLDNHFHKSKNETVAKEEWDKIVSNLVRRKQVGNQTISLFASSILTSCDLLSDRKLCLYRVINKT